jgi:hypothetical protein
VVQLQISVLQQENLYAQSTPLKEFRMTNQKRRVYVVPDVKIYGAVEDLTRAFVSSGSGDILSKALESTIPGSDVPNGCGKLTQWLCVS